MCLKIFCLFRLQNSWGFVLQEGQKNIKSLRIIEKSRCGCASGSAGFLRLRVGFHVHRYSIHQYHHLFSSTYPSWWREQICPSLWPRDHCLQCESIHHWNCKRFPMRNSTCPNDRAHPLCCKNMNGLKTRTPLPLTQIDTLEILINFGEFYFILLYK